MKSSFFFQRSYKKTFKDVIYQRLTSKYLLHVNEKYAKRRGSRMAVYANDLIGADIYIHGEFEENEIEDIFQLFELLGIDASATSAIDVGANIGNHTIHFAKKFAHVYAFEPNPYTFRLLDFNTNTFSNISLFHMGLSDEKKQLQLSENIANNGGSSTVGKNDGDTIEIQVHPLDAVFPDDGGNVKLIKIDVEGMELEVLRGGGRNYQKT